MRESWDRCIERARQLAAADDAGRPLLLFYGELLEQQKQLETALHAREREGVSGTPARDIDLLKPEINAFLTAIVHGGPELLAEQARSLLAGSSSAVIDLLVTCWRHPSDRQFFAKAVLQPYARWLAGLEVMPIGRELTMAENRCPFCGGAPQVSMLHGPGGPLQGGGRSLLCSTCLSVWPFRRVLCASCGEEDERKLAYFQSPDFDHVRIDACDTCRRYLKSVDLTRLGVAVPLVDEVGAAALDVWAREHDYEKIELNLVGL